MKNFLEFYNLKTNPFENSINKHYFFDSFNHSTIINQILISLNEENFILVVGESGVGKSILCLKILDYLNKQKEKVVFIPTGIVTYQTILKKILTNCNIKINKNCNESKLLEILFNYYEYKADSKYKQYFLIDNLQDFPPQIINQITQLTHFCNSKGFCPFSAIFFSNNSILNKLDSDSFCSLKEKVTNIIHLNPLSLEDTKEYIYFKLHKAGAKKCLHFSDETIEKIYNLSNGIPKYINAIVTNCLKCGAMQQTRIINLDILNMAIYNLNFLKKEFQKTAENQKIKYDHEELDLSDINEIDDQSDINNDDLENLDLSPVEDNNKNNLLNFNNKFFKNLVNGLLMFIVIGLLIIGSNIVWDKIVTLLK